MATVVDVRSGHAAHGGPESIAAVRARLQRQVSARSAAVFRIAFGLIGFLIAVRYIRHGWVGSLLVDPPVHFAYPGLEWVRPWPEPFTTLHVIAMGAAALAVAIGWRHRLGAAAFLLLFAWVELIDRTLYINHYYWIGLTAALLIVLPVSAAWSVDAARHREQSIPMWVVWALRFQVGMVYVFAGIAKLNSDWLFHGEPLATWLGARTDIPVVGPLLGLTGVAVALSWAGAAFDLTIVGWLSWRRTRVAAYAALAAFHLTTWLLFPSIGLFPLVMTLGALVFFRPTWPNRLLGRLGASNALLRVPTPSGVRSGTAIVVGVYVATMIILPASRLVTPETLWTGDGYQMAWRVMLSERAATADFRIVDVATGDRWVVDGPTGLNQRQAAVMASDPALLRQAAHMIEDEYSTPGRDLAVYADAFVAFNGRPHQRFIDPTIDLTAPLDGPLGSIVVPLEDRPTS